MSGMRVVGGVVGGRHGFVSSIKNAVTFCNNNVTVYKPSFCKMIDRFYIIIRIQDVDVDRRGS